jgi:hypothetical protein
MGCIVDLSPMTSPARCVSQEVRSSLLLCQTGWADAEDGTAAFAAPWKLAVQVRVLEVEATLSDRLRTYWTQVGQVDGQDHPNSDSAVRAATLLGSSSVPLAKLLAKANKPGQAIWQIFAERAGERVAVGNVALETAWLPACAAPG